MTDEITWVRMVRPERGDTMRFFMDSFGRWAAADNSGTTPNTTDDGTLWLSPHRVIKVEENRRYIDVISDIDGKMYTTSISKIDAIWLVDTLGYKIDGSFAPGDPIPYKDVTL
jgi:hypothetical protein